MAVQVGETLRIYELGLPLDATTSRLVASQDLGPDALAFPRLLAQDGMLFLAYRDHKTAYLAPLPPPPVADGIPLIGGRALGPAGGNDPVCVGHGWVAWQDENWKVFRVPVVGGTSVVARHGAPTGLSRIRQDGSVVLVDEDRVIRLQTPSGVLAATRPSFAGTLVVAEHPESGVACSLLPNPMLKILWPGQETFTPRCAVHPSGTLWAVATWGKEGIRVATLTPADFGLIPAPLTYEEFVGNGKAIEYVVARRYHEAHGAWPAQSDLDHNLWRLLVEHYSLQRLLDEI